MTTSKKDLKEELSTGGGGDAASIREAREVYLAERERGAVSPDSRFALAWQLVRSERDSDIVEGCV